MASSYQCPFCKVMVAKTPATHIKKDISFLSLSNGTLSPAKGQYGISLHFNKCPNCQKVSIIAFGYSEDLVDLIVNIYPQSLHKNFPDFIPLAIRSDYEEAASIVNLSPKASATLSRRCLQGMIRDFWEVKEDNLAKAITAIQSKVSPSQWKVINGVRRLGNIGAHMEKDINTIIDIDPDEAHKLIQLIERLIVDWYVNRAEQDALYDDIIAIDEDKQAQRL